MILEKYKNCPKIPKKCPKNSKNGPKISYTNIAKNTELENLANLGIEIDHEYLLAFYLILLLCETIMVLFSLFRLKKCKSSEYSSMTRDHFFNCFFFQKKIIHANYKLFVICAVR